jgi:alpha-glucosidase
MPGIGIDDPQPDAVTGLHRARAATTVMLALPGSAYLYQGEELGLPEATRLPDDALRDPTWERSGHRSRGRDGCRVPMPWEAAAPSLGFGPGDRPWLPQPPEYADLAVDRQDGDETSTLEHYRRLLRARRELRPGLGRLTWRDTPDDVIGLDVALPDGRMLSVFANLGTLPFDLPDDLEVLIASDASAAGTFLPPDTAAWTRPVAR